jgi:DHA2 family multidrug resistance protein
VQQATLLAYVDTFRRLAFLCLVCIAFVLLLRRVTPPREPISAE